MRQPLQQLLKDLAKLFDREYAKLWFVLATSTILQIAFWYLASPGPSLLQFEGRNLISALNIIVWALVLLMFVPNVLVFIFKLHDKRGAYGFGNAQFGLRATTVAVLIGIVLMFYAATDSSIQASYPWAGAWVGESVRNLFIWTGLYALYYISYENFYRGFLLRTLEPHLGLSNAIWFQALASTFVHLGKPFVETLAALPAGLVFAVLAVRSRSLLYPILLHLAIGIATDVFSLYHQGLLLP